MNNASHSGVLRMLVFGVVAVLTWKVVNVGATAARALGAVLHLPTRMVVVTFAIMAVVAFLVRRARIDADTRASRRQAWRVQWRWPRLAPMLGLSVIDPPTGMRSERRPRVLIPIIRVSADAYGLLVSARTLPRLGRDEWQKVAPHLANAWGCVRVAVTQEEPGRILIRAVRRDPLTEPASVVPSGDAPAQLDRWDIGRDEFAAPVSVPLANVPGLCISGLPGSGKTSVINGFIAQLAPSPAVQIAVIDGKGGADYEDLAGRFFAFVADDQAAAAGLLRELVDLRRQRSERIRSVLGVKNFWHVGPSVAWPLVLLVVDEAHTFLCDGAVKGDKERTALALESRHLVEDLVKKGRSVGMLTILATQKMTGDAIPTAIRDVCPVAMSFAVRTDESAVAALGADIRQYPEANPVGLQGSAYVGVASMVVEGRPGFTRVRTPYVREEDVAAVCSATSGLTRDPALLMDAVGGLPGSAAVTDLRYRWPIDPVWRVVQGAEIGSPCSELVRVRQEAAAHDVLVQGLTGYLTSLLAHRKNTHLRRTIGTIDAAMATGTAEDIERAIRMALEGMTPAVRAYCDRRQRRFMSIVEQKRERNAAGLPAGAVSAEIVARG